MFDKKIISYMRTFVKKRSYMRTFFFRNKNKTFFKKKNKLFFLKRSSRLLKALTSPYLSHSPSLSHSIALTCSLFPTQSLIALSLSLAAASVIAQSLSPDLLNFLLTLAGT